MEPAELENLDSPPDSEISSELDAEADLASLLDGVGFADCVARLERHWPTGRIPCNLSPVLQRLGRFEIRKELGRGRFGVVFLAWDPQLQRLVALKVPQFDAALDPELRERFRGEALAAAKLQHPGIVGLYEVGQQAGVDYLAMAYVEGMTLAQRLKNGPLPAREAAVVVSQLAHAVHHAHDQGVIHRDLKPSNVLLDLKGRPHVMDFGLARRLSDSAMRATATGQVLGTPAYMPPEQATGQSDIRATSDVYSLGVILYETLTGHPPFQAATFLEAVEFILNRDPLPPSKLNPKLPRELDAIVFKCLEKSPARRYASAAELAEDLERFLDGRPIRAKTHGYWQQGLRWCRKYPSRALLLVASFMTVALLVATANTYSRWQRATELATQQRRIADAERYFATVHRARNVISRRAPGWSQAALREIDAAASNQTVADRDDLRALASECLGGFDLEYEGKLSSGMLVGRIAMSPDGKLLAVGELKGSGSFRVLVFDVPARTVLHRFTILNFSNFGRLLKGDKKWQDGVREFAFSGDGRFLAAGLRFGDVYVFDLEQPAELPHRLEVPNESEVKRIAFSHDGKSLFAISKNDDYFIRWRNWRSEGKFDIPSQRRFVSFVAATQGDRLFSRPYDAHELLTLDHKLEGQGDLSPSAAILKGPETGLATDSLGRLLAGESDYGLRVYDAENGHVLRRLQDDAAGEASVADDLAMTADGKLLSAYDSNGVARLFELGRGRQVMNLVLGRYDFQDIALDPQGERLVVVNDTVLEFWRINHGRCRQTLNHLADALHDVEFAPDGKSLIATGNVGSFHGPLRSTLLEFSLDPAKLSNRIDSGFHRLSLEGDVGQVAYSPTANDVLWAAPFGAIHYSRSAEGRLTYRGPVSLTGPVIPVNIRGDGSAEGLRQIDNPLAGSGTALQLVDAQKPISLHFNVSQEVVLNKQAAILMVSLQVKGGSSTKAPFKYAVQIENHRPVPGFAPRWLVASRENGFQQWAIHLPAPATSWKKVTLQLEPASHVHDLQIERADVVVLSCERGSVLQEPSIIDHLQFSADGQHVWAQIIDEVQSFGWLNGEVLKPWANPQHANTGAANTRSVCPIDNGALIGSRDGCIFWLDRPGGSTSAIWQGPGKEVTTLAVCKDAKLILAGAENGKVRGLEHPTGEVLFDLPAAEEAILSLAATPDGKWMATGTLDRQLKLWRRNGTGYEIYCQLPETSGVVRQLHFSPDGSKLAVLGRATGMLVLWDLAAMQQEFKRLGIE